MKIRDENFGRMGYCCVFEADMKAAWSNERRLFRKIASSRIFMAAYKEAADERSPFANVLTHDGIKYKAEFLPLPDRRYLCIAYP